MGWFGVLPKRPLYLGEFGAFNVAAMDARVRWTQAVVEEATLRRIPYAYWELRSGFGLYDLEKGWHRGLLEAPGMLETASPMPAPTKLWMR